mgnify:CR=1 FL=1
MVRHGLLIIAARGADTPAIGVGRGSLGALISPSLQIAQGIDDPSPDLPVAGPRAVGAVLFQGAPRQAEVTARFGGPQVAVGLVQWGVLVVIQIRHGAQEPTSVEEADLAEVAQVIPGDNPCLKSGIKS